MSFVGRWLGYSYRRRLLDRDLIEHSSYIQGRVLDVGGASKPRGRFYSNRCSGVLDWMRLNISPEAGPHVRADVVDLPLREACADTVICTEVLEYVDDPGRAFKELVRALRPGGHLVLSVPFVHRVDSDRDRWRFSGRWLEWQARRNATEVMVLKAQGGPLAVLCHVAKTSVLQVANRWLRAALGLMLGAPLEVLFMADQCLIRAAESGWTTGYLLVARKGS